MLLVAWWSLVPDSAVLSTRSAGWEKLANVHNHPNIMVRYNFFM
ncbi:hypothetical protein NC99_00050 [Sunxiuqinia dokdonensis]|uniref:Uncharacterized protein n=1 Tax=Sunxiuqinia dokdonensis TaxID=1409788 RepID=A0A0L8VG96_9BACT|nr:hypothetical protein NC99_00050 [Sunxiuqinia dokdonensis]